MVKGGLLDPYGALFAPLEVLYGTRFGSKHYIMAQLANVYRGGTTDPFLDFLAPVGAPKRPLYEQIKHFWDPEKSQKSIFRVQNALYQW